MADTTSGGGGVGSRLRFLSWLFCVCSSLMGVQLVYSIEFGAVLPLLKDVFHISPSTSTLILGTAGPISGFVVQPIVGVFSDSLTSSFGRRRPFILAGAIFSAVGMVVIATAEDLGALLGDHRQSLTPGDHAMGIVLAVVGLWVTNCCVNVMQGPARAIVVDIVSEERQQDGNAMASGVMGLAAIVGNVLGAQLFLMPKPYRNLFLIGSVCILLSVVPTMLVAKEKRFVPAVKPKTGCRAVLGAFGKIVAGFRTIPRGMIIIVVVFFLSWAAYDPYMVYATTWFQRNVFRAKDEETALLNKGMQVGMYGNAIFAAVQWVFSLLLAPLLRLTSVPLVYAGTQLLATVCFAAFYFIPWVPKVGGEIALAYVSMALLSTSFTTMNAVPFGLVREVTAGRDAGLYMGVLNAASVVAQTVTNFACSGLLVLFAKPATAGGAGPGEAPAQPKQQNVAVAMLLGAGISSLATVAGFFLHGKSPSKSSLSVQESKELADGEVKPLLSPTEQQSAPV